MHFSGVQFPAICHVELEFDGEYLRDRGTSQFSCHDQHFIDKHNNII